MTCRDRQNNLKPKYRNAIRFVVVVVIYAICAMAFQNCGDIKINKSMIVEPFGACDPLVYSVSQSWDPDSKSVQFFLMEVSSISSHEFTGPFAWSIDGVVQSTSSRPSVSLGASPNCSKKIIALANFTNNCSQKIQKGTDFLDPRCTTAPACAGAKPADKTENPTCPVGQTGTITEVTRYVCSDNEWKPITDKTNNCAVPVVITPVAEPPEPVRWDVETPIFPAKVCVDKPIVQEYNCDDTSGYASMMYERRLFDSRENNTVGTASLQMIDWMQPSGARFDGEPAFVSFVTVAGGDGNGVKMNFSLCRGDFSSADVMQAYAVKIVNGVEVKGTKIKVDNDYLFGSMVYVYFGEKTQLPSDLSYSKTWSGQMIYVIVPARQPIFINFKQTFGLVGPENPANIAIGASLLHMTKPHGSTNDPRCRYQKGY